MRSNNRITKQIVLLCTELAILYGLAFIYNLDIEDYFWSSFKSMVVSAAYMAGITVWGVTIYKRVMNTKIRDCLIVMCVIMLFWVFVRTMKFYFIFGSGLPIRICWYSYYVGFITLPLLSLYAAMYVGKDEDYRVPVILKHLNIPAAVLIVLIFTNEFHEFAFKFVDEAKEKYTYGILYYIVVAFIVSVTVAALVITYNRCTLKGARRNIMFPVFILAMALAYSAVYIIELSHRGKDYLEVTPIFCATIIGLWESLIQGGFIRANTDYDTIFEASTISAKITDDDYNIYYSSKRSKEVPRSVMKQSERAPYMIDNNTRLKNFAIRSGHFLWLEDVSLFNETFDALSEARKELSEKNGILAAEVDVKKRQTAVAMQNRLYDQIAEELKGHIEKLDRLIKNTAGDNSQTDAVLGRAAFTGAYIKRRTNLVILGQSEDEIKAEELSLALRESAEYMRASGAVVDFLDEVSDYLYVENIKLVYDIFEDLVEDVFEKCRRLYIELRTENGDVSLVLMSDMDFPDAPLIEDRYKLKVYGADFNIDYYERSHKVSLFLPGGEAL